MARFSTGCGARLAAVAVLWLCLGWATPARAQSVDATDMASGLGDYYRSERDAAFIIGGMGLAAAGGGAYLVTRGTDFTRGVGWTWVVMGGLQALGGAYYVYQVQGQIEHYGSQLERDPSAYRSQELEHMRGTTSRFAYYLAAEVGLTLAGAGIAGYGFAAKRDLYKGVGLGMASLALPLLVIDANNNARAGRYLDSLERFQLGVTASGEGMQLGARGRF